MKRKLAFLKAFIVDNWKLGVGIAAVLGILGLLLSYQLTSLTGGFSESEASLRQAVTSDAFGLQFIAREALFLPYTFLVYLLQFLPVDDSYLLRLPGVIFGILGTLGMFYIFRKWYNVRIAFMGSVLFATSSWFLHTARFASPDSSYLLIPLLVAAMIGLQAKARSRLAILAVVVFGFTMIYLPGLVFFIIPALIIKRTLIIRALKLQPVWFKSLLGFISVAMLTPLALSILKPIPGQSSGIENAVSILGLPYSGNLSPATMLEAIKNAFGDIFIYSTAGPVYTVGHLPWFDICTTLLILLGIIQFAKHWKLDRSKLLAVVSVASVLLIAFNGPVSTVILLPIVYLLAVEGLRWLLSLWMEVFPKNPFARSFAVAIIFVLLGSIASYQMNKYYLAWAKAPETRQVFTNN